MYESGFLRDHVGDAINDGISNAKLLVDQLIGFSLVPGEGKKKRNFSMMKTVVTDKSYFVFKIYNMAAEFLCYRKQKSCFAQHLKVATITPKH